MQRTSENKDSRSIGTRAVGIGLGRGGGAGLILVSVSIAVEVGGNIDGGVNKGVNIVLGDRAVFRGVDGHDVADVLVDSFDNINFTSGRPAGTEKPN